LDSRIPAFIVAELLKNETTLALEDRTRDYLRSCQALIQAAPYIHAARESLRGEIRKHFRSLIQGALAVVDFGYLTGNTGATDLPPEFLAEGCSYLIALQNETLGPLAEPLQPYEEVAAQNGYYHQVLETAYRIRRYYHFEIGLDEFDYRFTFDDQHLVVTPPNAEFEQSLRLGYINAGQQIAKSALGSSRIEAAGYQDLADWISKKDLFARVERPIPRIRMKFPIFKELLELFEGKFFREESDFSLCQEGSCSSTRRP